MVTAVLILILVSFKDELSGLIDLYSTLQGNLKVYFINTFITGVCASIEFYYYYWIIEKIDKNFWIYMGFMLIVNFLGAVFGTYIIHNKKRVKNFIRKKRIAKAMTKKWEERKQNIKTESILVKEETNEPKAPEV